MTWSQRRFYIAVEKAMNVITTHLITVSTLNLKKIVRLRMAKQKSLTNIYSGIDIKKFSNSPKKDLRDELYLSNSVKLIGFIGRFSEQKSPLTLLRAVGKVVNRCHDCHFLFVGDGPKKSEMESFVQHNKLDEKVSFLGFRLDIPEILHSLDLFVLSSIYEGLGRSITEALCCKVPVVATAVEGVPELIRHKKTGLLVRPNDPVQLSNAIIYALENPERMKQMANVGSLFVRENFDVSNMVKKIDAVYTSLINV